MLPSRLRPRHRARTGRAQGGNAHIFPPDLENNTLSVDLYAPRPEAITYARNTASSLAAFPLHYPGRVPPLNKETTEMASHFFLLRVFPPIIHRRLSLFLSSPEHHPLLPFQGRSSAFLKLLSFYPSYFRNSFKREILSSSDETFCVFLRNSPRSSFFIFLLFRLVLFCQQEG